MKNVCISDVHEVSNYAYNIVSINEITFQTTYIVLNLYMDLIHYHPDVNKSLVDLIPSNNYKVTGNNKDEVLDQMKILADKCINEYAKEYFDEINIENQ